MAGYADKINPDLGKPVCELHPGRAAGVHQYGRRGDDYETALDRYFDAMAETEDPGDEF